MKTSISVTLLLVGLLQASLGAVIEVPDELVAEAELSLIREGLQRVRREVSLSGEGGSHQGVVQGSVTKPLYQDDKTRIDGTLGGGAQWQKNFPTQYSGSARLDGDRTLWSNGPTSVHGTGFAQRDVGTGMRPHDSFGAGAEVRHTLATGKHGSLEAFGGYQRQWNTPDRNHFNTGVTWRF